MQTKPSSPWLMLVSRSVLFLIAQLLITLVLSLAGTSAAWDESPRWWFFFPIFANAVSIYLLFRLFRAEGKRYLDVIKFSRATLKTDLLWFVASTIIGMPIISAPMSFIALWIFGDPMAPTLMMFRPVPTWSLVVGLLFPLTIGFAELPTYFAYAMPRLEAQLKNGWAAWLIASFFLAAQHVFLPLILNGDFMLWRLLMYVPFALFAGLLLKLRPTLLPYMMIVHTLADLSALAVYFMI